MCAFLAHGMFVGLMKISQDLGLRMYVSSCLYTNACTGSTWSLAFKLCSLVKFHLSARDAPDIVDTR